MIFVKTLATLGIALVFAVCVVGAEWITGISITGTPQQYIVYHVLIGLCAYNLIETVKYIGRK